MEILLEFVIQVVAQILVELVGDVLLGNAFRGVANVLRSTLGRYVTGALLGFGFGLAWGDHLSGQSTWPKLLWVSLALAGVAVVLAVNAAGRPAAGDPTALAGDPWRDIVTPPWRWRPDRLVGFVVVNLAIAGGIGVAFNPGPS